METQRSPEAVEKQSQPYSPEVETKRKDSVHERGGERPKINLLQSSKDRLRRRLKEKVLSLSGALAFHSSKSLAVGHAPCRGGLGSGDPCMSTHNFSWSSGVSASLEVSLCFFGRPFIDTALRLI